MIRPYTDDRKNYRVGIHHTCQSDQETGKICNKIYRGMCNYGVTYYVGCSLRRYAVGMLNNGKNKRRVQTRFIFIHTLISGRGAHVRFLPAGVLMDLWFCNLPVLPRILARIPCILTDQKLSPAWMLVTGTIEPFVFRLSN